ncbi:SHOCT domain-containing protein [Asanoa sp. NPDC049518]|uniref:SHOCT domain-containing protein n=1 Tax=unclassified Asanoa TaxID=2685164 RepID=UPI0034403179
MPGHGLGFGYLYVLGLMIITVLAVVVALLRPKPGGDEDTSARRVLADRLARGEISEDDYRRLVELLRPEHPRR